MTDFVAAIRGIFDNLNPFNTGNLIVYFTWLVVYTFTLLAIWRSNRRWLRLLSYLVNQIFSIGIVLSWTLTVLIAYTYWVASLATIVITLNLTWWLFRDRPKPVAPTPEQTQPRLGAPDAGDELAPPPPPPPTGDRNAR